MTQALKYKLLSAGNVVICDGEIHTFPAYQGLPEISSRCWCHRATPEQLKRWHPTFAAANAARIEAKYGQG